MQVQFLFPEKSPLSHESASAKYATSAIL